MTTVPAAGGGVPGARRHLQVACAIIERNGLVLVAQRGAGMSLPFKWEFPGGKIDPGESPQGCLRREIREELLTEVEIVAGLPPTEWRYPDFSVTLHPFVCALAGGEPSLTEHCALRWLPPEDFANLDWADADAPVLEHYAKYRTFNPA